MQIVKNSTGVKECGPLLIIPPDDKSSSSVVETDLPALCEFLCRAQTRRQLEKWSEGEGIRMIQGGRFEIYLDAPGKSTKAFDWMAKNIRNKHSKIDNLRSRILNFCKTQARIDPRVGSGEYVFDNFSLLVSFDPVEAQWPHLDMIEPNFQFGLMITAESPGTIVFEPVNRIATMDDARNFLWNDLPHPLGERMQSRAHKILNEYGNVLCRNLRCFYPGILQQGTICSMPGGVIHAGPACNHFRAVLFFSACPKGHQVPYHADIQFFAPTMCTAMVAALGESFWSESSHEDRCYLFRKVADASRAYPALEKHLLDEIVEHRTLKAFLGELRGCKNESGLIEVYASSFFERISVDDLEAEEETDRGVYSKIRVYQNRFKDIRRIYVYWIDLDEWEPAKESQHFKLTMDKVSPRKRGNDGKICLQLFNGENGLLQDDEGDIIRCRIQQHTSNA